MVNKEIKLKKFVFNIAAFAFLLSFVNPQPVFAASSVIFQPNFQQVSANRTFKVDVLLRTDQSLVGVDIVAKYDKKILEVVSIEKGPAFDLMPLKAGGNGSLKITGLTESSFTGTGKLATITFSGKKVGETKLTLVYKPKSTLDSNFTTAEVKDVLSTTVVGTYQVGSGWQRTLEFLRQLIASFLFPFFIFMIFVGIAVYLYLRWRKKQEEGGSGAYTAPDVPLDRPPENY